MQLRAALLEYLAGVGRLWWGFVGSTLPAAIGFAKDMTWLNAPFPSWAWWCAATIGYFIAHFCLFVKMREEREKLKGPRPDMRLKEALLQVLGPHGETAQQYHDALQAIRENANLGFLKSWGRHGTFLGNGGSGVLHEIPREHWSKYEIDYLPFVTIISITRGADPALGKLGPENNHDTTFEDIWFSRAQVNSIWSQRKSPRFVFQWPLKANVA